MEPEFIDEERIPLLERDENNDDSIYEDSQAETSFTQEDEQRQQELDVEINALERGRELVWCVLVHFSRTRTKKGNSLKTHEKGNFPQKYEKGEFPSKYEKISIF